MFAPTWLLSTQNFKPPSQISPSFLPPPPPVRPETGWWCGGGGVSRTGVDDVKIRHVCKGVMWGWMVMVMVREGIPFPR